jgi:hypothetical protein
MSWQPCFDPRVPSMDEPAFRSGAYILIRSGCAKFAESRRMPQRQFCLLSTIDKTRANYKAFCFNCFGVRYLVVKLACLLL